MATHEAGHCVVGLRLGLTLNGVSLGDLGVQSGGHVVGGTKFEAPNDDQKELARQKPELMAVVSMAGSAAERLLLGRYMADGWIGDIEILRCGLGWIEGGPLDEGRRNELTRYVKSAEEAVDHDRNAIIRVGEALRHAGSLSSVEVVTFIDD
jgi:hypothetical protein